MTRPTMLVLSASLLLVLPACQGSGPTEPALGSAPDFLIGNSPLSHARELKLDPNTAVADPELEGVRQ